MAGEARRRTAEGPRRLKRWQRAITLAAGKADDEAVTTGTRTTRCGCSAWNPGTAAAPTCSATSSRESHRSCSKAVSAPWATCDRRPWARPSSPASRITAQNRAFLLDALLRDEGRASALLDAVAAGRLTPDDLGKARVEALRNHAAGAIRSRSAELFKGK